MLSATQRLRSLSKHSSSIGEATFRPLSQLSLRGKDRPGCGFRIGDEVEGFKLVQRELIKERNVDALLFKDQTSGAELLHLDSSDTNNLFSVIFKTVPQDSTGVAHILEHTALCGSKRYPVRDPFFNMLKRSLNTFMNAMTASDWTMYPFSSKNEKDFDNLMDVYLDATFFPNLDKYDFLQEGWRLEFEDPNDPSSPLFIKGIVFNEMNGVMSDSSNVFDEKFRSKMYPTTTYHYNSGGEPLNIPDLSYEQLKKFHATCYRPSNARFFTYGDLPVERHLRKIRQQVLDQIKDTPVSSSLLEIPREKRFESPLAFQEIGPEMEGIDTKRQNRVAVGFLTSDISELNRVLDQCLLSSLLMNGPNSPLYKSLIESDIGLGFTSNTGFQTEQRESSFTFGATGVSDANRDRVAPIIRQTLEKAYIDGFEEVRLKSLIHQTELSLKQVTSAQGMVLLNGIVSPWVHGVNPVEPILVHKYLDSLKAKSTEEINTILKTNIEEYLLNNNHSVTMSMNSDPTSSARFMDELKSKEDQLRERLTASLTTPDHTEEIIRDAAVLLQRQTTPQNVDCLPSLETDDIPAEIPHAEINKISIGDTNPTPLFICPQPTNGITYIDSIFTMDDDIPLDIVPFIPLFCQALTSMDAGPFNYRELSQQIESHTGGISVAPFVTRDPQNAGITESAIMLHGSAIDDNTGKLFELIRTIVSSPSFVNQERLRTLIQQNMTSFQESLISRGHLFASIYASSLLPQSNRMSEMWSGITQFNFLQALSSLEDLTPVCVILQDMVHIMLGNSKIRFGTTIDETGTNREKRENVIREFDSLLKTLNQNSSEQQSKLLEIVKQKISSIPQLASFNEKLQSVTSSNKSFVEDSANMRNTFFAVDSSSVNFVAQSHQIGLPYDHPDYPKLEILAVLLSAEYLHREIREKGGAYGGGASCNGNNFVYYSYRDPQLDQTLQSFSSSIRAVISRDENEPVLTAQSLSEAKLKIFSDIDTPTAPSREIYPLFQNGLDHVLRQRRRKRLLAVTEEDIRFVADKYLSKNGIAAESKLGGCFATCVIGPQPTSAFEWNVTKVSIGEGAQAESEAEEQD
eukprot:TRINITY_DN3393_c0_g1_i1.p1 TRINITY_DN3393_c0_g1~~TRINITY_DN3393_c0_g1_i1.p1  ORF type:complete len:1084 (+),score=349.18 TRINITY_DN3393_c0_g1_i1:3-3254(+)